MQNVLVIGGGGYVGNIIIKRLIKHKFIVHCIDQFIYNHEDSISTLKKSNNFHQYNYDFRKIGF